MHIVYNNIPHIEQMIFLDQSDKLPENCEELEELLTKENIRQIQVNALSMLKQYSKDHNLDSSSLSINWV